jgi:hypothetical protein
MARTAPSIGLILLLSLAAPGASAGQATGPMRERCTLAVPRHLVVYGDGLTTTAVPLGNLATLPRAAFRGTFRDGRPANFEGVALWEFLVRAGVPDTLRSSDLLRSVVVEAADGYRARLSLAELSPAFRSEVPLLADRQDGDPIRPGFGPVQVIVPGDLRQSRWVRQVECLRVDR